MKTLLFLLALPLLADEPKPLATVEELTAKVAEQQKEIELLKADIAYLDKDRRIAYGTYQACMGPLPSQVQQQQRSGVQAQPARPRRVDPASGTVTKPHTPVEAKTK